MRKSYFNNSTTIDLGAIGQPVSIKKFNRRGEQEVSTTFAYSSAIPNQEGITGQGVFTEGAITSELLGAYYRVNRSTKKYLPTVLLATTTTTNGLRSRAQEEKFDFYTGKVLQSSFRNYLNDLYRSKIVPAYTLPVYAAMGPASENANHRNMLTQEAASYTYKVRPQGAPAVVGASIQTWNDTWTSYRGYEPGTDTYVDRAEDPRPVWRLHESYVWSSPHLNSDGTYADNKYTDFDWTRVPLSNQPAGSAWIKAGEFTRYDHYSKPLESKDLNGQYITSKLGHGQVQRLVTAVNARYTEVAASGAEDQADQGNGVVHFGGEVRDGGRRSPAHHHTGLYSTELLTGEAGFTYKALLGSEVRGGRKYRLSCWVHSSDAGQKTQLYAKVNGTDVGVVSIASANTRQAGAWRLLNLLVDLPTTGQLTVGCRNSGTEPVYVDDFRFHPLEGPATAYVYDPHTAQTTYVLDNENLYTRFEYDAAGKLARAYKEVLTPPGAPNQHAERKVKEYVYNYARMTEPNWLPTGNITWGLGSLGQVRPRQREERDINPLSAASFNTTRMVADGSSPGCTENSTPAPDPAPAPGTFLGRRCENPLNEMNGIYECWVYDVYAGNNGNEEYRFVTMYSGGCRGADCN